MTLSASRDSLTNPDNFLPTRRSLISRLRDWEDNESWQEFFDTYWRLIFSVALKSGLTHAESEEVVQETVVSVARKMDSFRFDPARGTFKAWLKTVAKRRIVDQFRKRKPDHYRQAACEEPDHGGDTATIDRIEDPKADVLECLWDAEWEQNLIEVTLERVKPHVRADHFQMFYMNVIQGRSCREVAGLLHTTTPQVYMVRHRVGKLVKQERTALEAERAAAEKREP